MIQAATTLAEMRPGQRGIVSRVMEKGTDSLRLLEMGLLPGTELTFVRKAPFGGPMEVEIRGFRLSLRKCEAAGIGVELR